MQLTKTLLPFCLAAALAVACSTAADLSGAPAKSDLPADLVARAKITVEQARSTARHRLPEATIASEELENEAGRLIYTFEMKTAGRTGIDEVNIDAGDGSVVAVQHEGPSAERTEQAAEAAGTKAATPAH